MSKFKIGNVSFDGNIFLAPMAGITDLPFRILCREQGASCVYTEMVSAKGLVYCNANTQALLQKSADERPNAVQIFGSDADCMAEAAVIINEYSFDILDINMGCPAPKIVKNGEGCALMRDPKRAGRIVEAVVNASKRPVTVKIRKGFNENNAAEFARVLEASGAAAIAVHGRTREQFYSGEADWSVIEEIVNAVKIPVIGNGDVTSVSAAKQMVSETGCEFVMIGRAALGDPWIFNNKSVDNPVKMATALRHLQMLIEQKGEYIAINEMRKHFSWYIKGITGVHKLRKRVNQAECREDFEEIAAEVTAMDEE